MAALTQREPGQSVALAKPPHVHEQPLGSAASRAGKQGAAQQLAQAGGAGKACGQGTVPLWQPDWVDIAL